MQIGTILRSFIGKNRDAVDPVELHSTQMVENDDIQNVEQMHIPGFQYNPPVSSRGFVARIGNAWKIMLGIFDLVDRVSLNSGEIILYSSSGVSIAASIRWNNDGSISISAPGDVNVTGNINITGSQTITGSIECNDAIIADLEITGGFASTPIELTQHPHIGDLGYNTGAPVVTGGGVAPPASPPSATGGDLDMSGNNITNVGTVDGKDVSTHTHSGVTAGGDNTGPPN